MQLNFTNKLQQHNKLKQEQKVRAREARKALGDLAWAGIDLGLDNTPTTFVGYTQNNCDAKVQAVCVGDEVSGTIAGGEKGIHVVKLSYTANPSAAPRTGTVTFKAGTYTETFTLTQKQ